MLKHVQYLYKDWTKKLAVWAAPHAKRGELWLSSYSTLWAYYKLWSVFRVRARIVHGLPFYFAVIFQTSGSKKHREPWKMCFNKAMFESHASHDCTDWVGFAASGGEENLRAVPTASNGPHLPITHHLRPKTDHILMSIVLLLLYVYGHVLSIVIICYYMLLSSSMVLFWKFSSNLATWWAFFASAEAAWHDIRMQRRNIRTITDMYCI